MCDTTQVIHIKQDFFDALWPVLLGSFLGFIAAFGVYLFQRAHERNKSIKETIYFLTTSVQMVIGPAKEQIEIFRKLIEFWRQNKRDGFVLNDFSRFHFKWFDAIDKVILQRAVFDKIKGGDKDKYYFYSQLIARINLLSIIKSKFSEDYRTIISLDNEFVNAFNQSKMPLIKKIYEVFAKVNKIGIVSLTDYEKDLLEAAKDWLLINDILERNTILNTYHLLVEKMERVETKYMNVVFMVEINNCMSAFSNFNKNRKYGSLQFEGYINKIENSLKRLQVICNKLNKS